MIQLHAHRSAHLFIIEINSESHIEQKSHNEFFFNTPAL